MCYINWFFFLNWEHNMYFDIFNTHIIIFKLMCNRISSLKLENRNSTYILYIMVVNFWVVVKLKKWIINKYIVQWKYNIKLYCWKIVYHSNIYI